MYLSIMELTAHLEAGIESFQSNSTYNYYSSIKIENMGLLNKIQDAARQKALKKLEPLLIEGEVIKQTFWMGSDHAVLTDCRLIAVDFDFGSSHETFFAIPFRTITGVGVIKPVGLSFKYAVKVYFSGGGDVKIAGYDQGECYKLAKAIAEITV